MSSRIVDRRGPNAAYSIPRGRWMWMACTTGVLTTLIACVAPNVTGSEEGSTGGGHPIPVTIAVTNSAVTSTAMSSASEASSSIAASSSASTAASSSTGGTDCAPPGGGCSAPGTTCCPTGPTVGPYGSTCISNDEECHSICHTGTDCSSGCCAQVTGKTYGVCAAVSYCQAGIGDACTSAEGCQSGLCDQGSNAVGWCTAACSATNTLCAGSGSNGLSNSSGNLNWCVTTAANTDYCFPGCFSSADCSPYPGTTCQQVVSVADGTVGVCATGG